MDIPASLIDVYGSSIGPYGIVVYCCLASQADADGHAAPSLGRLEHLSGLSRRSILRGIMALLEHGVLARHHRTAAHGGKETNVYVLLLDTSTRDPRQCWECPAVEPPAPEQGTLLEASPYRSTGQARVWAEGATGRRRR